MFLDSKHSSSSRDNNRSATETARYNSISNSAQQEQMESEEAREQAPGPWLLRHHLHAGPQHQAAPDAAATAGPAK